MKKKTYKPRRQRRRVPKARVSRSLTFKPYNYVFTLKSQALMSNPPGLPIGFSTVPGAGQAPLLTANIGAFPSTNGLSNFWDFALATSFRLTDIDNYGAFITMYDAYCITKVTCEVEFLNNISAVNGSALLPSMYAYWDQDDATTPTSTGSITGKQGVNRRQFSTNRVMKLSGKPRPLTQGEGTGSLINTKKAQWIDSTSPSESHYALKMLFQDVYLPATVGVNNGFRFNWKYHVSFRAPLITT